MRKLLWVVLIAAVAWSAYWFIGAQASKSAMLRWLEDRRAEGWQVEYSDLSLRGYPNRFDTTITDLILTDPETGISWRAPFFQIFALSYQPKHVIAVWPNEQQFATPFQTVDLRSEKMTASLVIDDIATLELGRAQLEMLGAQITSNMGWDIGFDRLNGAVRQSEGVTHGYDIAASADTLTPSRSLRSLIDADGKLPDIMEGFELQQFVQFDAPINRATIEQARPAILALATQIARVTWGELELRATGAVDIGAGGVPEGELLLNAKNWREMLAMAVSSGAVSEGSAGTAEMGLNLLSRLSGSPNSIDAPLSFKGGATYLGPVPIGPAPRLVIR